MLVVILIANTIESTDSDYQFKSVIVESGDTLWSIAAKYTSSQQDIRQVIFAIKRLNNIDRAVQIYPGQILQVPVPVSKTNGWAILTKLR